jgi:hypothetical protein
MVLTLAIQKFFPLHFFLHFFLAHESLLAFYYLFPKNYCLNAVNKLSAKIVNKIFYFYEETKVNTGTYARSQFGKTYVKIRANRSDKKINEMLPDKWQIFPKMAVIIRIFCRKLKVLKCKHSRKRKKTALLLAYHRLTMEVDLQNLFGLHVT